MSKYFLYSEISQKCQWKQFGKSPWEKTSSPLLERSGTEGKGGEKKSKEEDRKEKLLWTEGRGGEGREGRDGEGEGKEGGGSAYAVKNADPFPRWPLWTISRPTAGPENHSVPRLSLFPTLRSAGPAPRIYTALVVIEFPETAFIHTPR